MIHVTGADGLHIGLACCSVACSVISNEPTLCRHFSSESLECFTVSRSLVSLLLESVLSVNSHGIIEFHCFQAAEFMGCW